MATVFASDVSEGDTLVDLNDGYVIDVEDADDAFTLIAGRNYQAIGDDMTAITFHDANGEECYLIVPSATPLRTSRD